MLYVTDLDGTLLRGDLTISDYTRDVFNTVIGSGCSVTYSTARSYHEARRLLRGIDFRLPAAILNGVYVVDHHSGAEIATHTISKTLADEILCKARAHDLKPFLTSGRVDLITLYFDQLSNPAQEYFAQERPKGWGGKYHGIAQNTVGDVISLLYLEPDEVIRNLEAWLLDEFGTQIRINVFHDAKFPGYSYLQVGHANACKGRALEIIAQYLGCRLEDVVAFGDQLNDIRLFQTAGRGIAVGNAHPDIKMLAHEIIDSNDDDGVAQYIARRQLIQRVSA